MGHPGTTGTKKGCNDAVLSRLSQSKRVDYLRSVNSAVNGIFYWELRRSQVVHNSRRLMGVLESTNRRTGSRQDALHQPHQYVSQLPNSLRTEKRPTNFPTRTVNHPLWVSLVNFPRLHRRFNRLFRKRRRALRPPRPRPSLFGVVGVKLNLKNSSSSMKVSNTSEMS